MVSSRASRLAPPRSAPAPVPWACLLLVCGLFSVPGWASAPLAFTHATVFYPQDADGPQQAAVQLLVDEVAKRTGIHWQAQPLSDSSRAMACAECIVVGRRDQLSSADSTGWSAQERHAEAFRIDSFKGARLRIEGYDDRGMLYGIGYLLRHLGLAPRRATLAVPLHVLTAPQFAIRGHQLGYRFKNNTYDAWGPARFEQYIRDLAVFGTNTIELLPPHTDDAASSPLFPLPAMETMERVSGILKKYGLRCSVYYPAMADNYANPATVASELAAWAAVFQKLPQVDEVFVPGGDPGHTDPAVLFPFLAKMAAVLHRSHPGAGVWVSAQGFDAAEMQRFYALAAARPAWLTGIVVGPQSRDSLQVQRAHLPSALPIRFYPDIAHTRESQFPVPEWDPVFALTEGREVIDPRPLAETAIFRHDAPAMNGFVTYSEGVNDDVNKFVWTALGWSADADVVETLHEYARYFVGEQGARADAFARGVLALEQNWHGPIAANTGIDTTLRDFERMERQATPDQAGNWRFEEALYRAATDAYERHRFLDAQAREQSALLALQHAPQIGSLAAMREAAADLQPLPAQTAALAPLRDSIEQLAGELFHHIGLQLSVQKYGASAVGRGASLDTLDVSLNDAVWLEQRFARTRALLTEPQRIAAINTVLRWSDPGPGGFYDNLGVAAAEPHLVRGPGYPTDPAFLHTALDSISDFTPAQGWKLSAIANAGALYDNALHLRYTNLEPSAQYTLRIEYAGEPYTLPMTLIANGTSTLQDGFTRTQNPEIVELSVPRAATHSGTLDLRWTRPPGMGGGGRGLQVAEVWLLRAPGARGGATGAQTAR